MRLKCNDGKVRNFGVAGYNETETHFWEAKCHDCGELFGSHDTYIVKPQFKEHVCPKDREDDPTTTATQN
jgi:hypothetical protein